MDDSAAMIAALALADLGRRTAPPNPWVGCVLIRNGEIVGQGFHQVAGGPHAEIVAMAEAGERAAGSTAYVTLEPCAHYGRTPPCVEALVAAKVSRVVVAVLDPDPRVAGRGRQRLLNAGIEVDVGVEADRVAQSLAPYLHHRRIRLPYVVLKSATSLDGRTAAADGSSRWITGPAARADGHELRADSQAIIVGAGTATADRPSLTVRDVPFEVERQPIRVLLDARGRVPADGPLFDRTLAPTIVFTTTAAPSAVVRGWLERGAEVAVAPSGADGSGVDLSAVLSVLGERGVLQALVEGGNHLHAAFIAQGLANRLVLYVGGRLLGERGRPLAAMPGPDSIDRASNWTLRATRRLDNDVRLDYEPASVG